jgi:hypothetical protein
MKNNFGAELLHFAQSVDIIDEDNLNTIKGIIFNYLLSKDKEQKNGIVNIELCIEDEIDDKPALKFEWFIGSKKPSTRSVRRNDGTYYGQTSYAYDKGVPLWILGENDKDLIESKGKYLDFWSNSVDLPNFIEYSNANQSNIKTSIILPLRKKNKTFGVLNIEADIVIPFLKKLTEELENIAESISILIDLEKSNNERRENTLKAIETLNKTSTNVIKLDAPYIFLSYPKKCDMSVINSIKKVIQENEILKKLKIIDWDEMDHAGNINIQILTAIKSSSCGICYFSEKFEGKYIDNVNVIFEAGLIQAQSKDYDGLQNNWIPIREKSENKIPFNFASERNIIVPRNDNDELINNEFEKKLLNMLMNLESIKNIIGQRNARRRNLNEIKNLFIGAWEGKFNNGRVQHEIFLQILKNGNNIMAHATINYLIKDIETSIGEDYEISFENDILILKGIKYDFLVKGNEKVYYKDVFQISIIEENKLLCNGVDGFKKEGYQFYLNKIITE